MKYNLKLFKNRNVLLLLLASLIYIISTIMRSYSHVVESYYSSTLNKWIIQCFSQATGVVSFSIGEFLYLAHLIAAPILLFILMYKIFKGSFFLFLLKVIAYLALIYILFMLLWGMNYNRPSISEISGLEIGESTTKELYELNEALITKANALRLLVEEDDQGIMMISGGYKSVFNRAQTGYDIVSQEIKELDGNYGRPKPILSSRFMLYTGITGMYFPFTAEANINVAIPDVDLPFTVLHEMAHQRGFASEDEANYIAYLTASNHPDVDFQYSGIVSALFYSMVSLSRLDAELATELKDKYSDGLIRDFEYLNKFWSKYTGYVDQISSQINDTFLKGNGQEDGVTSYGRMVDLLMAHYKKYEEI